MQSKWENSGVTWIQAVENTQEDFHRNAGSKNNSIGEKEWEKRIMSIVRMINMQWNTQKGGTNQNEADKDSRTVWWLIVEKSNFCTVYHLR